MALSSGSPGLIGLLETWSAIEVRPTRPDWALHWSAWLGPLDAIALHDALSAIPKAPQAVAPRTAHESDLSQAMQQLRGDLTGFIRQLNALKALNRSLQNPAADTASTAPASNPPRAVEMKSVQQFPQSWQRIKVQDQVEHALHHGPANAGPLNSHRLVLRTLGLMQDLSLAYLHHFMRHLDTLLQLDTMTLSQAPKTLKTGKTAGRKAGGKKQT